MLIPLRMSAQSDEQLMTRAARGSDRAFEELYNRHARRLQGFFVRRLGDDADLAADFMHDTFLRLYAARETYREGRNFRAWLFTIAYNLCRNHHRNQLTIVSDEGVDITDEASVEVELDMKDLHDALRDILRKLPEPYAMLFSLSVTAFATDVAAPAADTADNTRTAQVLDRFEDRLFRKGLAGWFTRTPLRVQHIREHLIRALFQREGILDDVENLLFKGSHIQCEERSEKLIDN